MALDKFPLQRDHFSGGAQLSPNDGLRSLLNDLADTGRAVQTEETLRFIVDPVNGDDAAPFVETVVVIQGFDIPTKVATVRTMQGAVDRIPTRVLHPVYIDLPLGTIVPEGRSLMQGSFAVLIGGHVIKADGFYLDPDLFLFDTPPGIYVRGQKDIQLAAAPVTSATASSVTASSLSLTIDAHRGQIVEVLGSNSAAGQWRRAIRNDATGKFELNVAWGVVPNTSNTIQVWQAGSIIQGTVSIMDVGSNSLMGIDFAATVKIETGTGRFTVRNAVVGIAGEVEGEAPGSDTPSIHAWEGSRIGFFPLDFQADPTFQKSQAGAYVKNSEIRIQDRAVIAGYLIVDAGNIRCLDTAQVSLVAVDCDGATGGPDTAEHAIRLSDGSTGFLLPTAGAGNGIRNYQQSGVRVEKNSVLEMANMVVDNCREGVSVLSGSWANLRSVTGTGNTTYGAVIRGNATALVNRTGTTVTGTTADVRLGNATSGADHAWGDCAAGDALLDGGGKVGAVAGLAEWGVIMDRAAD